MPGLLLQTSCATAPNVENVPFNSGAIEKTGTRSFDSGVLHVESVVYSGSPDKRVDRILTEFMKDDFIPVYVRITNTAKSPHAIAETDFYLSDGRTSNRALSASEVPRQFRRFSDDALSENIAKFFVVLVLVALFVFLIAAMTTGKGDGFSGNVIAPTSSSSASDSNTTVAFFSDTTKTTNVDYRDFLISARQLEPGESVEGLLFFRKSKAPVFEMQNRKEVLQLEIREPATHP